MVMQDFCAPTKKMFLVLSRLSGKVQLVSRFEVVNLYEPIIGIVLYANYLYLWLEKDHQISSSGICAAS